MLYCLTILLSISLRFTVFFFISKKNATNINKEVPMLPLEINEKLLFFLRAFYTLKSITFAYRDIIHTKNFNHRQPLPQNSQSQSCFIIFFVFFSIKNVNNKSSLLQSVMRFIDSRTDCPRRELLNTYSFKRQTSPCHCHCLTHVFCLSYNLINNENNSQILFCICIIYINVIYA